MTGREVTAPYVGRHRRLHDVTVTADSWRCICGVRTKSRNPSMGGYRHSELHGCRITILIDTQAVA